GMSSTSAGTSWSYAKTIGLSARRQRARLKARVMLLATKTIAIDSDHLSALFPPLRTIEAVSFFYRTVNGAAADRRLADRIVDKHALSRHAIVRERTTTSFGAAPRVPA